MKRAAGLSVATLAVALLAACSAGTTPTVPSVPSPGSSTASSPAPTPSLAGCDDNDLASRVKSYRPTAPMPDRADFPSEIAQRGTLKVGVSADNLLFGYRNPISGKLEGFDIDMVNEVAKAIFGRPEGHVEYVVENFAQRIPDLQSGKVDMVADIMTINCTRWTQIAFSTEYFHAGQQLLVRKNSPYQHPQDLNDKTKTVCAAKASSGQKNLEQKLPEANKAIVDNISDCMVEFQQGTVDAIISDNTVVAGFAAQDPYARVIKDKITDEPYGLGFNKTNIGFAKYVNALLEQLRRDGTWADIYRKWLPAPVPEPPAAVYGRVQP